MNVTVEARVSSNMGRIRKGDRFNEIVRGEMVTFEVMGWPERVAGDSELVNVPVRKVGENTKTVRRGYDRSQRVKLV